MYIYSLPVESAFSGKCMLCRLTCVCDEYPPFICNSISQVTVASLVKCLALFSIMILSMFWSIALNARNFAQYKVSKMLVDSFSGKTRPLPPEKEVSIPTDSFERKGSFCEGCFKKSAVTLHS